ncbi:MAG: hypothetical protein HY689_03535 [Chloroflexi bacterium]|nr:hypothetical protein [Chloroflexota bacterium]
MQPSLTWRALIVALGFLITLACAIPVTYLPGLHGSLARGPILGLLYFSGLLAGLAVMAIGLAWPTVFFPEWASREEP